MIIKAGSPIRVVLSDELKEYRLLGMVGKRGIVLESFMAKARKNKGYLIKLRSPFLNEKIWFVPEKSVMNEQD